VLALAIAVTLVQAAFAVILALVLTVTRTVGQIRDRRFVALAPGFRLALSECASGNGDIAQFGRLVAEHPREFDRVFEEVVSTVRGQSRRNMGRIAEELGLDRRWIQASASRSVEERLRAISALGVVGNRAAIEVLVRSLEDSSDVVRLEAGLALTRVGGPAETMAVFEFALRQGKLVRILLLDSLRWRTPLLCDPIRRHLVSGNTETIAICLETVEAWRVALDLPEVEAALHHALPAIRERAFRVLPYVTGLPDIEAAILQGLTDSEDRVRTAATYAAGRLKVRAAVSLLEDSLNDSAGRLALTSAYSLAEIGPEGVDVLEKTAVSGKASSAAALEALERLRLGRFEHANL
jgi:HEAT repeat protein